MIQNPLQHPKRDQTHFLTFAWKISRFRFVYCSGFLMTLQYQNLKFSHGKTSYSDIAKWLKIRCSIQSEIRCIFWLLHGRSSDFALYTAVDFWWLCNVRSLSFPMGKLHILTLQNDRKSAAVYKAKSNAFSDFCMENHQISLYILQWISDDFAISES